jgi:hypothetical protein
MGIGILWIWGLHGYGKTMRESWFGKGEKLNNVFCIDVNDLI